MLEKVRYDLLVLISGECMHNLLLGYFIDAESTGIDKYLLQVLSVLQKYHASHNIYALAYEDQPRLRTNLSPYNVKICITPRLSHPITQYNYYIKLLTEVKFDEVYLNISEPINSLLLIAAKKCGVKKIIAHSHSVTTGTTAIGKKQMMIAMNHLFRNIVTRNATDYYACSIAAGHWMYTNRANKEGKVKIIYNPIDTYKFAFDPETRKQIRKKLNIENKLVLGHIGNYVYAKNTGFLIDVIKKLKKYNDTFVLILIGDGPEREEVIQRISNEGLNKYVIYLGLRNDVPELLQAMDIFVLPSIFEGLPISAIEAQASGLPIILSDHITQEVKITNNCRYLPITDPSKWAKVIHDISAIPVDRYVIKQPAFSRFDISKQEKQIINIFN